MTKHNISAGNIGNSDNEKDNSFSPSPSFNEKD